MRVIGTAGHVDHGKSSLVQALTGTHPDRLKEEREREMTIDLGFAWFTLPDGEEVGIVDVPGHRDFIENMLAGIGGIDAVIFVVAADEGVMPQTREHLAILDLLQIQSGVIALTKTDLVDADWINLVQTDLHQQIQGTIIQNSPIIPVSARSGEGIDELIRALSSCLADLPPRPNRNRPRLPIDRVFSIAGFGTIVTGTLSDGTLRTGDEIELLPDGLRGRIRGLQTHKKKEDIALPGSRTAINLSGISHQLIKRGDVIAHSGDYQASKRLDLQFHLLEDINKSLRHNGEVKFFIGAAEVLGRVRLLGKDELLPGETGFLQLELSHPVIAVSGDRFILRRPSPPETLGGGSVIDAHPKRRYKRFSEETIARLETFLLGNPEEILIQAAMVTGPADLMTIIKRSNLSEEEALQAVNHLIKQGHLILLKSDLGLTTSSGKSPAMDSSLKGSELIISAEHWQLFCERSQSEVHRYHQTFPLRQGMPKEELRSKLKNESTYPLRVFNVLFNRLFDEELFEERENSISTIGFQVKFSRPQELAIERLLSRFAQSPYAPPSVQECLADVGEDLYKALLENDSLIEVSNEVVFRKSDYLLMIQEIVNLIKTQGMITVARARDHFHTSRKYILALLEHMDALGLTIRDQDFRRLSGSNKG